MEVSGLFHEPVSLRLGKNTVVITKQGTRGEGKVVLEVLEKSNISFPCWK
jgi:hypothetical protein